MTNLLYETGQLIIISAFWNRWELLERRYTIENSTVHPLFWFSVVIVLLFSTVGFPKFRNTFPTPSQTKQCIVELAIPGSLSMLRYTILLSKESRLIVQNPAHASLDYCLHELKST
jgi:hypothetical protein